MNTIAVDLASVETNPWIGALPFWLDLARTVFALGAFVSLIFVYRQLKINYSGLKLNALTARHNMYANLTESISDKEIEVMKLHLQDYISESIYRDRYDGHPKRIQSFRLMYRKYLYLVFCHQVELEYPIAENGITETWVKELIDFHEFRDVHECQKHYYPSLCTLIDRIIATEAGRNDPHSRLQWMVDGFAINQAVEEAPPSVAAMNK